MSDSSQETGGLARGTVGSARVTAFGTSIVAPAVSVITVLVVMVSYGGFASPLIVLITFAGSLCCAMSIAEFARRVPAAGWAYSAMDHRPCGRARRPRLRYHRVQRSIRVLFAMGREQALPRPLARLSGRHTPVVAIAFIAVLTLALGLPMTYALGGASTAGYLLAAGSLAVVLVYFAGNIAVIRAFRTEFRDEFRVVRHLLIPAAAAVISCFPCGGSLTRMLTPSR